MITHVTKPYRMKKLLLILFYIGCFFFLSTKLYAQTNQTVTNGSNTTTVNFAGSCTYNWVNSNPSIGLAASGTGNIPSFTAINTGKSPVTATITATPVPNGFAYIANNGFGVNSVSVIDIASNKVIKTIPVGANPYGVTVNHTGTFAYVGNTSGNTGISVIDTKTNLVSTTIPLNSAPGEMVLSPDDSKLYVANYPYITIINTGNNTIVGSFTEGGNFVETGLAISPDGKRLYISDGTDNDVLVVNASDYTKIADIKIGYNPHGIVLSPDGSRLYVPTGIESIYNPPVGINDNLTVVNTANDAILATIPVGEGPYNVVLNSDGSRAYVANSISNSVSVINTINYSIVTTIPVGKGPAGLSSTADGSEIFVTNDLSNDVNVINTKINSVAATISIGTGTSPISYGNFIASSSGCGGPVVFTITVNPTIAPATITANAASGSITACVGTASASPAIQQFTVSGVNLTAPVMATAPTGFEVSLIAGSGYGKSVTLNQSAGNLSNTTIYVRSAAGDAAGPIAGNVVLSTTNVTDQTVAVSGIVNAIPTVTTPGYQVLVNGARTALITFIGTASTFSWTNDTPGIGLAASGTGDIPSFTAVNNTMNLVTATITVTPLNSTGCNGMPIEFTITVNPSPASLTADAALTPMTTIYGSPLSVERFTVSGTAITSGILITPPAGFEVSLDEKAFSPTVTINGTGNIYPTAVFIRLAASTHVGNYSGNVIVSINNAADATIMVPVSTVTRASLTITADNKTRPFGVVNPTLTVTYSGFVNNDSADQLTALPTLTTDATISSAVGQYAINANHDAASPDYMFNYNPGILTITPVLSALSIPNTFTPNGDGINDTWVIKDLEYYPKSTINIFNRWGQKLFTSIGYPIPWDGTYQGKALSSGTYYYIIDPKNGQALLTGWVAIIR